MPVKRPRNDGCQTETSDPAPIRLSVRALAEFACEGGDLDTGGSLSRMLEGSIAHRRIQASYGEGWRSEYPLRRVLTAPEISIELYGRCDGLYLHGDEAVVEEIKSTLGDVSLMTGEEYPAHWAQAQIYAAMLAEDEGLSAVTVRLRYVCLTGGEEIFTRRRTCQELRRLLEGYIAPMRNWLVRLFQRQNAVRESVKEMGFPFESFRPGQRRLSANVYVAMRDGRNLLCQAPTGTGKTAAVLFAALKALGEGLIERVFYLTARSTGRQAVLDALELMRRHGLDVRAVTVTAKDEICPFEKRDCRPEVCALAKGYYDRRRSAIEEALSAQIMDMQAITDLASKYSICPFELSLDVSENCDVVICDYNYAFDPRVRLQRFFMRKSMSGLLVDEAHNLCQRTRDMLSASLYSKPIAELRRCIGREWGRKAALYRASTRVIRSMEDCCQSEREQTSSPNAPDNLLEAVRDFVIEAKSAFDQPLACHAQLSDRMFECIDFLNAGERYDERMCTLFERQGQSNYGVTLYCADPSAHIAATLQKVRGAALFSATVTPMPFYRDILGLDGEKDALLDIPSPFDPANQLTLRYPLPMRYRDRAASLEKLTNALRAFIGAKTGNYLICFPSYSFMKQVYEAEQWPFRVLIQTPDMDSVSRTAFLEELMPEPKETTAAFVVMGGVFAEGIDLKGSRLIGAAVVGTGVPQISPRGDALTRIYETMYGSGYDYAYLYPGLCRVYQAAGRVIRRESDRGAVLLIDARWCEPRHEALLPKHWRVKTVRDPDALQISLRAFWMEEDASSDDIVLPHHQAVQVKAPDFKPGPEDQAQAEHPYAAQDD